MVKLSGSLLDMLQVTKIAYDLMGRYHGNVSCIDDGSEHPHRMSLQIRSDVLQDFIGKWSGRLTAAGVQVGTWAGRIAGLGRSRCRGGCMLAI